jgi:hypothetical protein
MRFKRVTLKHATNTFKTRSFTAEQFDLRTVEGLLVVTQKLDGAIPHALPLTDLEEAVVDYEPPKGAKLK